MDEKFTAIMKAFFEISGCSNQSELADWLGVQHSQISDARRRRCIPMAWGHAAACRSGLKPVDVMEKMDVMHFTGLVF